jgi:hypothetical protein
MADLAAIMARRRKMEEEAGEEGLYAPPSGGPRAAAPPRSAPRSAKRDPPSAQPAPPPGSNRGAPAAPSTFSGLQEEVESDEEDEMAAQIAAYQQQLRSAGAPGSGVPAPGSGAPAPRSQASGRVPDQSFDWDMAEIEEVEVEEDPGAQIAAYQLQLRSRDEADAVAGIACGNLTDVVASRAAPKSNTYSQPGSLGAQSARSLHSQMPPTQQSALGGGGDHFLLDGPTECTCDVGMTQLCPYCTMVCHDPLPSPRTPHLARGSWQPPCRL